MLSKILNNPMQTYVVFAILATLGLFCGFRLPVALFPQASRSVLMVKLGYGSLAPDDFRNQYGERIENRVRGIRKNDARVEAMLTRYRPNEFNLTVTFNWGADPDTVMQETQAAVDSVASSLPEEIRRTLEIAAEDNSSFALLAVFNSDQRPIDEVYRILQPQLLPKILALPEVESAKLMNPLEQEIEITLRPETLLALHLDTQTIQARIEEALKGQSAGKLAKKSDYWTLSRSPTIDSVEKLAKLPIPLRQGTTVLLSAVANIQARPSIESQELTKINGRNCLSLLVYPKSGSNLKSLSEHTRAVFNSMQSSLPTDISYEIVMDKADSVNESIRSLFTEVLMGSLLATLVLYLFIGSARNVLTAALEIPLSLVLAFILMKYFDVTINLFSLAGLALASGMNVDASVVVMENIFRHLDRHQRESKVFEPRQAIIDAVNEVKGPVAISTVASLVVFIPFLSIDGLGRALLGDLVKAIVFSHGFSAIVALILVPTIRYHFNAELKNEGVRAPLAQPCLLFLQRFYTQLFQRFVKLRHLSWAFILATFAAMALLCVWITQRLPQEIVGKPDSDWLYVSYSTEGNSLVRELEADIESSLRTVEAVVGPEALVNATFFNEPNNANTLVHVRDKSTLPAMVATLQEKLKSQPGLRLNIETWNQSEFSLTEKPAFRILITGGDADERAFAAADLARRLAVLEKFETIQARPALNVKSRINLNPRMEVISRLRDEGFDRSNFDLLDDLRVIGESRWIGDAVINQLKTPIVMKYPDTFVNSLAKLRGMPVRVGDKIVPLQTLMTIDKVPPQQSLQLEYGLPFATVVGYFEGTVQAVSPTLQRELEHIVLAYEQDRTARKMMPLAFHWGEPDPDRTLALRQLRMALGLSTLLLFLSIYLHFKRFWDALLVMMAVPFAIFGALLSLWIFSSNLSLNSLLGMTLLSGIAVNNSIMLVDFVRLAQAEGHALIDAIKLALKARLRPILITSLTTLLAMLPLALGFGEGGQVLRPLGISVTGGLLVSTSMTLIFVPLLQGLTRSPWP